MMFKKKVEKTNTFTFKNGEIKVDYNTIILSGNLSSFTIMDYNQLSQVVSSLADFTNTINIDVSSCTIFNSTGIGLIKSIVKYLKSDLHKQIKIYFNSEYHWQTIMIRSIIHMCGYFDLYDSKAILDYDLIANNELDLI